MDARKHGQLADVAEHFAGGDHFMDAGEHRFHIGFVFALGKFREQRGRRLGDATAGADEADVGNFIAVHGQEKLQLITAEGIVALGRAGGLRHFMEIARLLAVVKNDLLVKVIDIVKHIFNLPQGAKGARAAAPRASTKLFTQMMIGFKPVPDELVQFLARGRAFHALDDFPGKSMDQHATCHVFGNAPGAQVKNTLGVQLADGRAVGAFDVVRINFELRLGVRRGVVREQEIFIRLLGVGFLGDGMDIDAAVKNAPRFVVKDAVEIFVAGAMRLGMLDNHVMVGELLVACEIKPVQNALEPFACQFGADIIARKFCAEREGMDVHIAGAAKFTGDGRHVKGVGRFVLQFDVLDGRIVTRDNFRDSIGKRRHIACAQIALDDRRLAVRPGDDEIAWLAGLAVLFGRRDINQLDGIGDFNAGGNGNERAVREEGLVERGKSVVRRQGVLAEILFDEGGIPGQCGGKAFHARAVGNLFDARKFWDKKSVHKHETAAGQCGKRSFAQRFAFNAIDGGGTGGLKGQTGDGRDVGETPVLITERGKTEFRKGRDGSAAQGREPGRLGARGRLPERFNYPRFVGIFRLRHDVKSNPNLFMP